MTGDATFTTEQQSILDSDAVIRVARAAPGSGKTRVFVEQLRRSLATWSTRSAGIAALSFTNVAQEEIARRLGGHLAPPHFVGTLDSFVWRFVVRPFGHLVGVTRDGAQLVPAPLDDALDRPTVRIGATARDASSIFRVLFLRGTEDAPDAFVKGTYRGVERVPAIFQPAVLRTKRALWAKSGRMTHSDSQYLASAILRGRHGPAVLDLLRRRFPLVLVDEFQDTGWFLGRALLAIVARTRSLIVGDPDQAIYGFGGADRTIFADAETLAAGPAHAIRMTHRCSTSVAGVATELSRSGDPIHSRPDAPPGRAILLVHDHAEVTMPDELRARLEATLIGCRDVAVLARKGRWARSLAGRDDEKCPLSSGAAKRLDRAVRQLHEGEPALAGRIVARDLGELLLDDDGPSPDRLRESGIEPRAWRQATYRLLMAAAVYRDDETWGAWLARMKALFAAEAESLSVAVERKALGAKFRTDASGDQVRRKPSPAPSGAGWLYETIHKVKGREFDGVVVYSPKPGGRQKAACPSGEWWSTAAGSEEREIAFVAASRARLVLILCVHRTTVAALKAQRAEFVARFEVVEATSQGSGPQSPRSSLRGRSAP